MPKLLRFSHVSLRDLFVSIGPTTLVLSLIVLGCYYWIDPLPPPRVTLSTGQANSAYAEFGQIYAQALRKEKITVKLMPSLGSQENLQRLIDPLGGVDIAFVQSGSTNAEEAQRKGLISLGSLFTEPLWVFYRQPYELTHLNQMRGLTVNVGKEGTGVPRLFQQILSVNGIEPNEVLLGTLENTPATVALLEGKIDALVFSSAPEAPLIQMLLQTPGIQLFDFNQAQAYTRRLPFLSHVILPRGIVDFGRDIPSRDIQLIAPTATLVAREDIHPALVQLFIQAATKVHGGAGWFRREGDFPSDRYTEIPVTAQAQRFYRHGSPLLQSYLPFGLANLMDRMWVIVLALGALILPLSRVVSPLYVWRIRSRVYRWYGELRVIEQALEQTDVNDKILHYQQQLQSLNELEEKVNHISIPLSFADGLYDLRAHIQLVRGQVRRLLEA